MHERKCVFVCGVYDDPFLWIDAVRREALQ
jgi:hypothetical protein